MPVSFFGNRKGYYFYGIVLKNANVRLRFYKFIKTISF